VIIEVKFTKTNQKLDADFGEVQYVTEFVGDKYEGDYEITPKVETQTVPTKNKVLIDDMTIKSIPIYKTSNNSGGTTVYIAKET
jgi:hypothetical protein